MFISPLSPVFSSEPSCPSLTLPTLEIAELEGLLVKNVSGEAEVLDTETRQQILSSLGRRINRRRYVRRLKTSGYLRSPWAGVLQ